MGSPVFLLFSQKLRYNTWRNALLQLADKEHRSRYATLTTLLPQFTVTKLTLLKTTLSNRTLTSNLPKKSNKMENFLFLDRSESHENNELRTVMYSRTRRIPTDYLTNHSTTRSHTKRAQLVCDPPDSSRDENKYLERVFIKNNYNTAFIRRNIF